MKSLFVFYLFSPLFPCTPLSRIAAEMMSTKHCGGNGGEVDAVVSGRGSEVGGRNLANFIEEVMAGAPNDVSDFMQRAILLHSSPRSHSDFTRLYALMQRAAYDKLGYSVLSKKNILALNYDLFGVIHSFQPPSAQAATRSTCSDCVEHYSTAVRSEMSVGCAVCLQPYAVLNDQTYCWAPLNHWVAMMKKNSWPRVPFTVVISPSLVMDPTAKMLPDNFLRGCPASKIIVVGSSDVQEFGDFCFSQCPNLVQIEFSVMASLTRIGKSFVSDCGLLKVADFSGLTEVVTVADGWLQNSGSLKTPRFCSSTEGQIMARGCSMKNLREVGSYWMFNCQQLEEVHFSSLVSLQEVGHAWMQSCVLLSKPNLAGLKNLWKVGNLWLNNCPQLTHVDFSSMTSLEEVGDEWLSQCTHLTSLNFTNVSRLRLVGQKWLHQCTHLVAVNFADMIALETVGNGWMANCASIRAGRLVRPPQVDFQPQPCWKQ